MTNACFHPELCCDSRCLGLYGNCRVLAKFFEEALFERDLASGHEVEMDARNGGEKTTGLEICTLMQREMCHQGRIVQLLNALLCEEDLYEIDRSLLCEKKNDGFNARQL